ncbi:hypothetical protein K3E31_000054 [Escherichia coli]|nr:hypothetical protein [Escherichia coli]HAV8843226.1 hypothetical protein [Escherichia coli]
METVITIAALAVAIFFAKRKRNQ